MDIKDLDINSTVTKISRLVTVNGKEKTFFVCYVTNSIMKVAKALSDSYYIYSIDGLRVFGCDINKQYDRNEGLILQQTPVLGLTLKEILKTKDINETMELIQIYCDIGKNKSNSYSDINEHVGIAEIKSHIINILEHSDVKIYGNGKKFATFNMHYKILTDLIENYYYFIRLDLIKIVEQYITNNCVEVKIK